MHAALGVGRRVVEIRVDLGHVAADAVALVDTAVDPAEAGAGVGRRPPRGDFVLAVEVVGVARVAAEERPVAALAQRGAEALATGRALVLGDAGLVAGVGDRDRIGAQREAGVAVGRDVGDAMAGAAGDAGVGARIIGADVAVHGAVDQERQVVAAGAEAAGALAGVVAQPVEGDLVDGIVERRQRVHALRPLRGDGGVAARAVLDVGQVVALGRRPGRGVNVRRRQSPGGGRKQRRGNRRRRRLGLRLLAAGATGRRRQRQQRRRYRPPGHHRDSNARERRSVCDAKRNRVDASRARSEEGVGWAPATDERRRHATQLRDLASVRKPVGALPGPPGSTRGRPGAETGPGTGTGGRRRSGCRPRPRTPPGASSPRSRSSTG